jgi:alkaline phosphatase D
MTGRLSRRRFLSTTAGAGVASLAMPYLRRAADRPVVTHGVQSGDVGADGGVGARGPAVADDGRGRHH